MNLFKINPLDLVARIPNPKMRLRALDVLLNVKIPFNRWLGLQIIELADEKVVVRSPPRVLRQNHVGSAHACALALMGEYAAGLWISQHYSIAEYRFIISELNIRYYKQGRGELTAQALAPVGEPSRDEKNNLWLELKTEIYDAQRALVSECQTRWQIKPWNQTQTPPEKFV